ncbi:uncharacterized protein LOC143808128 isoform X2 [Ranitomeya variabilis]|uniref:uncharacterized protein LOC143808128 isoform X2 n=1 Tax=Ranitomeya variabilis TaxID=490064 RepID=UPI004056F6BB
MESCQRCLLLEQSVLEAARSWLLQCRKNCTTSSPEAGILYLAVANTCQNQARTAVDHSTRQSVEKRRFTDLLLEIFCIGRSTATAANSHMENVNRLLITPSTSKILLFSAVQHPVCPS